MKALIILLILPALSYGQIGEAKKLSSQTVGKLSSLGEFIAQLSFSAQDADTVYALSFQNKKFTSIAVIESISFSGRDSTVEKLYSIFKSVFLEENKKDKDYNVSFLLGKEQVVISRHKVMGINQAMLMTGHGYFEITEKQVDKLFGKN